MSKRNILHIIYQSHIIGGVERFLETLLKDSPHSEKILETYSDGNKTNIDKEFLSLNESNRSYNPILLIYYTFKRGYLYKKVCIKNHMNISISHGDSLNISNIISKKIFNNKTKVIIFLHNSLGFYTNVGSKFYKYLFSYLYPKADKIVTISDEMQHEMLGNGYTNTTTLYNPLDFEKINILKNKDLGKNKKIFHNNKTSFITTGRLEEVKNIKFLIDCFREYHRENKNSQFIILGDGSLKASLQDISGDESDIYILGHQENIYKFIKNSHFFIFSSLNEGFGRVLIEALACGVPVVTHDFKYGAKEIMRNSRDWSICKQIEIHENGILSPYLDRESFIKSMKIISETKFDRNKIQGNISKYSVKNSLEKYNVIIKNV